MAEDDDTVMLPSEAGAGAGPSTALVKKGKRFEIKKWNAVALWAWGMSLN